MPVVARVDRAAVDELEEVDVDVDVDWVDMVDMVDMDDDATAAAFGAAGACGLAEAFPPTSANSAPIANSVATRQTVIFGTF